MLFEGMLLVPEFSPPAGAGRRVASFRERASLGSHHFMGCSTASWASCSGIQVFGEGLEWIS